MAQAPIDRPRLHRETTGPVSTREPAGSTVRRRPNVRGARCRGQPHARGPRGTPPVGDGGGSSESTGTRPRRSAHRALPQGPGADAPRRATDPWGHGCLPRGRQGPERRARAPAPPVARTMVPQEETYPSRPGARPWPRCPTPRAPHERPPGHEGSSPPRPRRRPSPSSAPDRCQRTTTGRPRRVAPARCLRVPGGRPRGWSRRWDRAQGARRGASTPDDSNRVGERAPHRRRRAPRQPPWPKGASDRPWAGAESPRQWETQARFARKPRRGRHGYGGKRRQTERRRGARRGLAARGWGVYRRERSTAAPVVVRRRAPAGRGPRPRRPSTPCAREGLRQFDPHRTRTSVPGLFQHAGLGLEGIVAHP